MTTSFYGNEKITLAIEKIERKTETTKQLKNHHVFVVDCSGSMANDLPKLRKQLKEKLLNLVRPKDIISIIWFSGKRQAGIVIEGIEISTVADMKSVHDSIDKFIRPVGLTGFVDPLKISKELIEKFKKSDNVSNLVFMSDGYDNEYKPSEIISICSELSNVADSSTFVEYGYYANRKLISEMAETLGGTTIFCENFEEYNDTFIKELQKTSLSKKFLYHLGNKPLVNYVVGITENNDIISVLVENNSISIPEDLKKVIYVVDERDVNNSNNVIATLNGMGKEQIPNEIYALLKVVSFKMDSDKTFAILGLLGDVMLINQYTNCFSKKDYNRFQNEIVNLINEPQYRFMLGQNFNAIPKDDAFTVLDLLDILVKDGNAKLHTDKFQYNRIGGKSVAKDDSIKFEYYPNNGSSFSDLVYASDRANVSIRVKYNGFVAIPKDKQKEFNLPEIIDTHIYRNYTIIKDGIVNIPVLPVSISNINTLNILKNNEVVIDKIENEIFYLNIENLPVINRKMTTGITSTETFKLVWEMKELEAEQKVWKNFYKENFKDVSLDWVEKYGYDAVSYLEEIGLTTNGFNPKVIIEDIEDPYVAPVFKIKVSGMSSLPSVNAVEKKLSDNKKLTISEWVMNKYLQVAKKEVAKLNNNEEELHKLLSTTKKNIIEKTREHRSKLTQIMFSMLVGHVWFTDKESMDDNMGVLDVGFGKDVDFVAEIGEVEIKK